MCESGQTSDTERVYALDNKIFNPKEAPVRFSQLGIITLFTVVWFKSNKRLKMTNLTSMPCEYKDDTNLKKLETLWGDSWNKLTPKQKQLVAEILSSGSKN
jgi:hypothetical protein